MKVLLKSRQELDTAGRWDIDFHLPPEGIKKFPSELLKRVDAVADIARDKRDPTKEPEASFQYIDIAAVDVSVGVISNPQVLEGSEAPSRARKVVRAYDLIVSTCRPTRGAVAVVPVSLHNQIASTAFSVVRPRAGINPFYLHFALRLPSTLEQFRKWSTGSSYPAILDSDVKKTLIPVPSPEVQDAIAERIVAALRERDHTIRTANSAWRTALREITASLTGAKESEGVDAEPTEHEFEAFTLAAVQAVLTDLPALSADSSRVDGTEGDLFVI